MTKIKKTYKLAVIFRRHVLCDDIFISNTYSDAFVAAKKKMESRPDSITGVLIYSNIGTHIVIKNKDFRP